MPGLIPLIKKYRPELPIVYRSHIEIRSDLVHNAGSPQEEVWKYLWQNIQLADLFISTLPSKLALHPFVDVVVLRSPCEQVRPQ
jgi:alpha,alpha-trehalose phosphorylase (configuration-retaining)